MASGDIVGTLRALLGSDNDSRNAAEKCFSDAEKQQPAATVSALFQAVAQQQLEEPVREQAAVLLRRSLGKASYDGSTWQQLGAAGQAECKAKLLELLSAEPSAKVRRKIADVVQSLGNQIIEIAEDTRPQNCQEWPELMPLLMRVVLDCSADAGLRADALWTVKELITTIWPIMVANSQGTIQVLKTGLTAQSEAMRNHAGQLLCELVQNLEHKQDRALFQPLIPDLCNAAKSLAEVADNTHLNSLLQAMQVADAGETAEYTADFFKDAVVAHLLPMLSTIAKSHAQEDTQRLALEALVSLAEGKPKALAKVPGFVQAVVEVSVHFMMQLDDDLASWQEEDDEEAEEEENFANGKEVIDRICRCMHNIEKFSMVLEILKPVIGSLFAGGNWKQTVAGLAVLSQIAEYVEDEAALLQMFSAARSQLGAANPRVRHAAWTAVAQFAQDHSEIITQDSLAPELLKQFLEGIDDPVERVQHRNMEAFQMYGSELDRDLLEPCVQPMMEKLGRMLQGGKLQLQKQVITQIAVLAGQMEDGFAPFYGPLMPILKQLIQKLLHQNEERMLLGKAFECVSLLAAAVTPEVFRADAEVIMQSMLQATQVPNLPSNDPVKEYMLNAAQRLCSIMKTDFLPFVPHILPGILEKFSLAPKEFTRESKVDPEEEVHMALKHEDGKVKIMIMATSEVEDMNNALECCHTFVQELGKSYAPYVAQTAQALLNVFDFTMNEDIRDLGFETWGLLCEVAREGCPAGVLGELLKEFLSRLLPQFETPAGGKPPDEESLKTAAMGVTAILKKAGPNVLSVEQVQHIFQVGMKTLNACLERRAEKESKKKAQPKDEDANDDDEEEEGMNVRLACCDMIGSLMAHHASTFVDLCLPTAMQVVVQFLQPGGSAEDRRMSTFLACDMLEHLREKVVPQWPQFLPMMLQDIMHPSAAVRQPACYGAAFAAKEAAFAPMAADVAAKLAQLISQTRTNLAKRAKKSNVSAQACADNACTALVEILMHHSQALGAAEAQLWTVWINGLPIQVDEEEGIKNHKALLRLVQAENAQLVGENMKNLPQIISVLVDVYKGSLVDDETSKGIGQLVLKLAPQLEQLAAQLKEKHRKKLMRIHRDAHAQA